MSPKTPRRRKRVEDVRCPAVKDLPDDGYDILHHSYVEILKMRRSIESADALIDMSREAVRLVGCAEAHAGGEYLNTPPLPICGDAATS